MENKFGKHLLSRSTGTEVAFTATADLLKRLQDVDRPLPKWWPTTPIKEATELVELGYAVSGRNWFYGLTLNGFDALSSEVDQRHVHRGLRERMSNWREIIAITGEISPDITLAYEEYADLGFKLIVSTDDKKILKLALEKLSVAGFTIWNWRVGMPAFYQNYRIDLYRRR